MAWSSGQRRSSKGWRLNPRRSISLFRRRDARVSLDEVRVPQSRGSEGETAKGDEEQRRIKSGMDTRKAFGSFQRRLNGECRLRIDMV